MPQDERRYVPGRVPGKKKVTLYVDQEVARRLRVVAAEDGRSQSEIVEELLRRMLGGGGERNGVRNA